jgi:hypothetical protein
VGEDDEDITSTSTPAAPSLQAPPSGSITRARARELNYVMVLKNEGYVAGFGLRTNVNLWRSPRLHPDSVLGDQVLDGKLIKSTFIWVRNHCHIFTEAAAIVVLSRTVFLFTGRVSCRALSPCCGRPLVAHIPRRASS